MTWTKLGDEFSDECAAHELSDSAFRTHVEAIGWIYRVEQMDLRIPKHLVRRFAGSAHFEEAIDFLVSIGWWKRLVAHYEIVHHREVIRSSITMQQKKRERDRKAQQRRRSGDVTDDVTTDVSDGVSADVGDGVSGYADSQTDKQLRNVTNDATSPTDAVESAWRGGAFPEVKSSEPASRVAHVLPAGDGGGPDRDGAGPAWSDTWTGMLRLWLARFLMPPGRRWSS